MLELLCVLAAMPCLPASAQQNHGYTGMVSFGDSLSDLGNTVDLLGPDLSRIFAGYNSNFYYDGRFSNGPIWAERLYAQLGFGVMARNTGGNEIGGTNFSWSGSTSGEDSEIYEPDEVKYLLPNLLTQIGFYSDQLEEGNPALPEDPSTTLFTIWSGGNDVSYFVESGGTSDPSILAAQIVANISTAVSDLYAVGGRTFLVGNLPPMGFKPDFKGTPKEAKANEVVDIYTSLLANELNSLSLNLAGIRIELLDAYSLFTDILNDPGAYGFTNVTQTAYIPTPGDNPPPPYGSVVDNPEQYLFWDNSHGTIPVSELLASAAYQSVTAVPEPSAASMLVLGFLGLVWRRMRK